MPRSNEPDPQDDWFGMSSREMRVSDLPNRRPPPRDILDPEPDLSDVTEARIRSDLWQGPAIVVGSLVWTWFWLVVLQRWGIMVLAFPLVGLFVGTGRFLRGLAGLFARGRQDR